MNNFKLFVGHSMVDVVKTTFPAGESCIRINDSGNHESELNGQITFDFRDNSGMFDLALLTDACHRRYAGIKLTLFMKYLPYARQDRVCNAGESLSIKVVADLVNSLNFARVICNDIHSSVGNALIHRLEHIDLVNTAYSLPRHAPTETTALVSPDAGAEKKVFDFAKYYGYSNVVRSSKVRNVLTGKIESTSLIDPLIGSSFLIVDDICDGGRTFIELAKAIKADSNYGNQTIALYVTHGIFSAGLDVFDEFIDTIYVANLMNDSVRNHPKLVQL